MSLKTVMRERRDLSALLKSYQRGEATIDAVLALPVWNRIASKYLRRWRAPADVTELDVVQEIRLGVWRALGKFKPERANGYRIGSYAMFHACSSAERFLVRVRKTRNKDGAVRFELGQAAASKTLAFEEAFDRWQYAAPEEHPLNRPQASPSLQCERREALGRALEVLDDARACCVVAFIAHGGDFEAAERELRKSAPLRRKLGAKASEIGGIIREAVHAAAAHGGA